MFLPVLFVWEGCFASDEPGPVDLFRTTRDALSDATARHRDSVLGTTDLGAITTEEGGYLQACRDARDTFEDCLDAMDACGGMMDGPMMGDPRDASTDWWDAVEAHHDGMAACGTAVCGHEEEMAWQTDAEGLLDDLEPGSEAADCRW